MKPDTGAEPSVDPTARARLISITLDPNSIRRGKPNIEHEREVAIFDILENNSFKPEGHDGGPYKLMLAIIEDRLSFAISEEGTEAFTFVLSLTPLKRVMKDYFMVCESYHEA